MRLHGGQGHPVPEPDAAHRRIPSAGLDQSKTGGFLDPIVGTVLLTLIGIAIATPLARRDRGLARRVRPPVLAGAGWSSRASRSSPGRPTSCSRSSACVLFQQRDLQLAVVHRRGRRGLRPLVPDGGGDDVADRAAAGLRLHARGAAVGSRARARGQLRAWARRKSATIRRVLLPSVRPNIAHRHGARDGPDRRRHRDRRDPARRDAAARSASGGAAAAQDAAGHRQHAHQLRLQQLARRGRATRRRRPTRPRSCCCCSSSPSTSASASSPRDRTKGHDHRHDDTDTGHADGSALCRRRCAGSSSTRPPNVAPPPRAERARDARRARRQRRASSACARAAQRRLRREAGGQRASRCRSARARCSR